MSEEESYEDKDVSETWIGEYTRVEEGEIVPPAQPVTRQEEDHDIHVAGNSNHDFLKTVSLVVLGDEP